MKTLDERLNGLRWRLQAMRRLWSAGAKPDMTFLAPEPFDAAPRGRIEAPRQGDRLEHGNLDIAGWVVFPSAPISRIEMWIGEESLGRARVGVERPDLVELSDSPYARVAGFNLTVDLDDRPGPNGDTVLRATAISTRGERHDLEPVPITVAVGQGPRSSAAYLPLPPRPTPKPQKGIGRPTLVYTHQLNLGGAQLYLMDLIRALLEQGAVRPTVVSAMDGALREELEGLGIPVHIAGPTPMEELSPHLGRLEELALWSAGRDFELVLVNTATALALPGAELARELGIPAVWSIHESFPLSTLWGHPDPRVREHAEAALADAALVLFEADATRQMFAEHVNPERAHVLPYGLDFAPIDAARGELDRTKARRDAGIPADAELVLCVGTVEPRKAQLPLAQAFEQIAARHPKAHLVFVGGDDKRYSSMLADYIAASELAERMELVPVTPDVQTWYGMADLFVCASDVESLPRTVLEAMAWETPVVATSVFGLPELIDDGETGWLCEPRDTAALADALDRALSSTPEQREQIGRAARSMVEERHSLERYGREVARLLDGLVAGPRGHSNRVNA